jgi:hypothetical protein
MEPTRHSVISTIVPIDRVTGARGRGARTGGEEPCQTQGFVEGGALGRRTGQVRRRESG